MILPTKFPADDLEDSLPLATDEQILVKLCDRDSNYVFGHGRRRI